MIADIVSRHTRGLIAKREAALHSWEQCVIKIITESLFPLLENKATAYSQASSPIVRAPLFNDSRVNGCMLREFLEEFT